MPGKKPSLKTMFAAAILVVLGVVTGQAAIVAVGLEQVIQAATEQQMERSK